jgi:hypothetical protein
MSQINIRVDPIIDALPSDLASRKNVPKAVISRDYAR